MASRPRLRSSSRKDSPVSPPKPASLSVVIDASLNQNKRQTRSSREPATAQQPSQDVEQGLSTLVEEKQLSEQIEDFNSSISVSSEGSSITSSLESLLDALDRESIIDNLIKLRNDSDAVFSIFERGGKNGVVDICAKLLQSDPLLCRKLLSREEQLLTTMEVYGGSPGFIIPAVIIRKLTGDGEPREINNTPWRPDGVLYLANLALQLVQVFRRSLEERRTYLEFMFHNFPAPFHDLDAFPFSDDMVKDTYHLYMEILTQFYIQQVEISHGDEEFDPDEVLGSVFYDEHNNIKGSSDEETHAKAMSRMSSIRSHFSTEAHPWVNVEALRQQFLWSDFVAQAVRWSLARKRELDDMINSKGGIEKLIDALIADDFQDEAGPAGGFTQASELADPKTKALSPAADHNQAEHVGDANRKYTSSTRKAKTGPLLGKAMKANIDRLKAFKVKHSARNPRDKARPVSPTPPEPEQEIPQSPSPVVDETQPAAIDESESQVQILPQASASAQEIAPTQQTSVVLETIRRQNQQSDKENKNEKAKKTSLLDRQEGAERVEWDEPSDNGDTPPPPQPLKRRRPQASNDDAGPDEFETDKRATKRARASGDFSRGPSLTTRASVQVEEEHTTPINKDARIPDKTRAVAFANRGQHSRPTQIRSQSPDAIPGTAPVSSSNPAPSRTQTSPSSRVLLEPIPAAKRRLPPSSAPVRTHPGSFGSSRLPSERLPASQLSRVNQEAKERVRMSRELLHAPQGGQVRRPYTEEEVDRLLELIALYGTRWARILQEDNRHEDGPRLQDRTQVQLKDKARNIKLVYLKSGHRLPPGFESVSVGLRKIQELQDLGISYIEGQNGARYARRRPYADDGVEDIDDIED
ncbi:hypothetical protein Z517_08183 [Fonsecaea pedrosoi CBS 271.37]|uniref:Myb-like domain-containing protein n=1 Tax=Fonsecaea pedrosoi CBS 271.37 TaxID=1442368 RepID=A0A0D2GCE1_9EURO|nr:uncharacterized protein Z517_08183 [Fonsecaea pedrosoi CBS 271.37]KIW78348.1 hypothetical protein Z517_08183 [Fonsecaea pedrosoi CBS 271.37]